MAPRLCAADNAKVKVLERCDLIDPKVLRISEAKAKIVTTQDPNHRKVLELVMIDRKLLFSRTARRVSFFAQRRDFQHGASLFKQSSVFYALLGLCVVPQFVAFELVSK